MSYKKQHLKTNTSSTSWNMSYRGGLTVKTNYCKTIITYWTFRNDMTVNDWVVIKGKCIVIPKALQQQALKQLHINHMCIKKTKLLMHKSVYWIGMNADIENHIKTVLHALFFQQTQPKGKLFYHDIPGKP